MNLHNSVTEVVLVLTYLCSGGEGERVDREKVVEEGVLGLV